MRLNDFVSVFRRFWYVIVVGAILGLVAGMAAQLSKPASYTATTTIYSDTGHADYVQAGQSTSLAIERMNSYATLVKSERFGDQVRKDIGSRRSARKIAHSMTTSLIKDTVMMQVQASAPTANQATAVAGDVPKALTTLVGSLAKSSDNKVTFISVTDPKVSKSRSLPSLVLSSVFGLVLGTALATALLLLIHRLRRRVTSPDEAREVAGVPVVGILPKGSVPAPGVASSIEEQGQWDATRRLALNLGVLGRRDENRVVAVTAPVSTPNSRLVARGLAAALASNGERVLLLDRRPNADERSGADWQPATSTFGLAPDLEQVTESPTRKGLFVTPHHLAPASAAEWLPWRDEVAQHGFDRIVIDAPTVLDVDAAPLHMADSVLVVVDQGRTRRDDLRVAADSLRATGVHSVGLVMDDVVENSVPHLQRLSGLSLPDNEAETRVY